MSEVRFGPGAETHPLELNLCFLGQTSQGFIPLTALPSLAPNISLVQLPSPGDYISVVLQLYQNINLRRRASRLKSASQLSTPANHLAQLRLGLGGRDGLRLTTATFALSLALLRVPRD